jgi:hypothetical protein
LSAQRLLESLNPGISQPWRDSSRRLLKIPSVPTKHCYCWETPSQLDGTPSQLDGTQPLRETTAEGLVLVGQGEQQADDAGALALDRAQTDPLHDVVDDPAGAFLVAAVEQERVLRRGRPRGQRLG